MIGKIDHLGLAVQNLDEAAALYEKLLGAPPSEVEEVPEQKVRVVFFEVGESHVELLEPTSPESPIAKFMEKRGPGIQHVAYRVDDVEAELARAKAAGLRLIDETPRIGAGGARIAFVHPKSTGGVLTEFCQRD